jgi:small subunit ribosomal protein S4
LARGIATGHRTTESRGQGDRLALFIETQRLAKREIPDYVVPDGTTKVTFTRIPTLDEVPYPVRMEPNLVVEFYSR